MNDDRDPEASPVYRLMVEAIALAFLLILACLGPDVEEHNLQQLREFVRDR